MGLLIVLALATGSLVAPAAHSATVKVEPDPVWIERGRGQQFIAADLVFTHDAPDTLELTYVEVSALDASGRLLSRRFIGANGTAPSIQTIAKRQVVKGCSPSTRTMPSPTTGGWTRRSRRSPSSDSPTTPGATPTTSAWSTKRDRCGARMERAMPTGGAGTFRCARPRRDVSPRATPIVGTGKWVARVSNGFVTTGDIVQSR